MEKSNSLGNIIIYVILGAAIMYFISNMNLTQDPPIIQLHSTHQTGVSTQTDVPVEVPVRIEIPLSNQTSESAQPVAPAQLPVTTGQSSPSQTNALTVDNFRETFGWGPTPQPAWSSECHPPMMCAINDN